MMGLTRRGAILGTVVVTLVVATLAISIGVNSKAVRDDSDKGAIKIYTNKANRILIKRAASTTTRAPTSTTRKHLKSSAGPGTGSGTTKKHRGRTSTHKSTRKPSTTTSPSTTRSPSTTSKSSDVTTTSTTPKSASATDGPKTTTTMPSLGPNQKWLAHEELIALEHMLAGAFDWWKVLMQNGGHVYDRRAAGEIFYLLDEKLTPLFAADNKPKDLKAEFKKAEEEARRPKKAGEKKDKGGDQKEKKDD